MTTTTYEPKDGWEAFDARRDAFYAAHEAEQALDPHKYDCKHCGHSVDDEHAPNCPAEDWLRNEES